MIIKTILLILILSNLSTIGLILVMYYNSNREEGYKNGIGKNELQRESRADNKGY